MINKYLLSLSGAILTMGSVVAQSDLPPNAVPGKCYAKCLKPAQFTTRTEQYVSKEAGKQISVRGAEIGTQTEQVLVGAVEKYKPLCRSCYQQNNS